MKYNFLFLKKIYSMFGVFLLFCNSNLKFQSQIFTEKGNPLDKNIIHYYQR